MFRLVCLNNVTKRDIYSKRVEKPFLSIPTSLRGGVKKHFYCLNLDLLDLRINLIGENNVFVRTFNAVIATMKFTLNLNKKEFNMSKTVSKFAFTVGLVLAMAFTFSCSEAQAADNEKRIIGTWAELKADGSDGNKWVFNSDGTGIFGKDVYGREDRTGRYAFVDGKLALIYGEDTGAYVYNLSISTDGKTAIVIEAAGNATSFGLLLRKKN